MSKHIDSSQEGYIPVTGGLVWYRIINPGYGIPLLTLHGGPGSPHDYLEPLEGLANERSVIFYDQLGCGKSERPDNELLWTRDRFIEELSQVQRALQLKQFHLFGHSWGTMLAIDYALTEPDGLASLILASPALSIPHWLQDMEHYRQSLSLDVQEILTTHENNGTTDSDEYQTASMEFYQRYLCRLNPWPASLERTLAGEGTAVYNKMWGPSEFYMTGNLRHYDCTPQLSKIHIPTLFTCGRYDEATPETTLSYQHLVAGSELVIFEQSAHMAHLEETARYLQTLRDFLQKADSSQET